MNVEKISSVYTRVSLITQPIRFMFMRLDFCGSGKTLMKEAEANSKAFDFLQGFGLCYVGFGVRFPLLWLISQVYVYIFV